MSLLSCQPVLWAIIKARNVNFLPGDKKRNGLTSGQYEPHAIQVIYACVCAYACVCVRMHMRVCMCFCPCWVMSVWALPTVCVRVHACVRASVRVCSPMTPAVG